MVTAAAYILYAAAALTIVTYHSNGVNLVSLMVKWSPHFDHCVDHRPLF